MYVRETTEIVKIQGQAQNQGSLNALATTATMAQLRDEAGPKHPNLAIGLTMSKPGIDPGGMGIKVLASIAARGYRTRYVGTDRAYVAANPERVVCRLLCKKATESLDFSYLRT